jgi:hypothetical protein
MSKTIDPSFSDPNKVKAEQPEPNSYASPLRTGSLSIYAVLNVVNSLHPMIHNRLNRLD